MDVSITIASYNTKNVLRECLRSIVENTKGIEYEIIVVDNASIDGSPDMVQNEFPQVKLIVNDKNLYLTKAQNQAFRESKGRYILILNSDIKISQNILPKMIEFMDSHSDAGAGTCRLINTNSATEQSPWDFLTLKKLLLKHTFLSRFFLKLIPLGIQNISNSFKKKPVYISDVIGDAFMIIRRDALFKIGFYDENLKLYYTEDDICKGLDNLKVKRYFYTGAKAFHIGKGSESVKKISKFENSKILKDDAVYYSKKHFGFWKGGFVNFILSINLYCYSFPKIIKDTILTKIK